MGDYYFYKFELALEAKRVKIKNLTENFWGNRNKKKGQLGKCFKISNHEAKGER